MNNTNQHAARRVDAFAENNGARSTTGAEDPVMNTNNSPGDFGQPPTSSCRSIAELRQWLHMDASDVEILRVWQETDGAAKAAAWHAAASRLLHRTFSADLAARALPAVEQSPGLLISATGNVLAGGLN